MNALPIILFSNRSSAEPVHRRLAQEGFTPSINEGPRLTKLWFVSGHSADVRIEVPQDQYNRAEQFLIDLDQRESWLNAAIRCPECGSFRVDFPQYARHSLLTNLAMGILAKIGLVERDYYCEDCHFTWPRAGYRASRARPNSAPYYFLEGVEQTRLMSPRQDAAEDQREAA